MHEDGRAISVRFAEPSLISTTLALKQLWDSIRPPLMPTSPTKRDSMKDKSIPATNDIDVKWHSEKLIESIGFRTKAGNRIKDYLNGHGIVKLSLRELIDLFLPPASTIFKSEYEFWVDIPILKQPQFGPYLYDSALLTLTEAELGAAFRAEWMQRIYSLKLHELRHRPANKSVKQTA